MYEFPSRGLHAFCYPVPTPHQRRQPFDVCNCWPRSPKNSQRRCTKIRQLFPDVCHETRTPIGHAKRISNSRHISQHILQRYRHDRDQLRRGRKIFACTIQIVRRYRTNTALLLGDDDRGIGSHDQRVIDLIDGPSRRGLDANLRIQFRRWSVRIDARRGRDGERRYEGRIVASVGSSDEEVGAAESTDDFGGSGEEGEYSRFLFIVAMDHGWDVRGFGLVSLSGK
mmetsp:Transcript_34020/g.82299  ORF Transcript_34020/g.82299 Transcript_34020/m.82299 type:complete len:226 (-) Transcript_34020:116-793(-)